MLSVRVCGTECSTAPAVIEKQGRGDIQKRDRETEEGRETREQIRKCPPIVTLIALRHSFNGKAQVYEKLC